MKTLPLFIAYLWAVPLLAQSASAWTLEQCLQYAADNNLQVKQADLATQISKNNLLQSQLTLLPDITGDASYNFNFGNSVDPTRFTFIQSNSQSSTMGLSGSLPLFTGLQQLYNIAKNKNDVEASKQDYNNTINTVALNITNLFLQTIVNKELLKIAEKQVEISQAQYERAQKQVVAGTLAEASLYEFEAQKMRDASQVVSARNNVELSLLSLKIALQLPDEKNFDIAQPEVSAEELASPEKISAQSIYEYALMNQPAIRAAEARIKAANYQRKMAWGSFSPTISAQASLRSNYFDQAMQPGNFGYKLSDLAGSKPIYSNFSSSDPTQNIIGWDRLQLTYDNLPISFSQQLKNNFTKIVSFNLSLPIFNSWQRMTNLANSKLQIQARQYDLENAKNTLRQDIERAYTSARASGENYFASKKTVEAARKSYEAVEKRFGVGMSNLYEVQQSRNNLVRAESQLVQAKYTYVLQMKVLDFYMGKTISLK